MALGRAPYAGYGSITGSFPPTFTISVVSPADSANLNQTQPTFTVLPNSTDGSTMTIEWQWDTNPSFNNSSGFRQTKTTSGNADEVNAATTPSTPLGYHTYYWRARAGDGSGSWSTYTAVRSFFVQAVPVQAASYFQMNVGFAAALLSDTGLSANEFYMNVGFPEALISEYGPASSTFQLNVGEPPEDINVTGDADKQFQMYVVSRANGQELPPTIN